MLNSAKIKPVALALALAVWLAEQYTRVAKEIKVISLRSLFIERF